MELYTLRMDCKEAKDELYREATWVRSHLVELYGSKRSRDRFGLSERTPRGAADLADEVSRLVRILSRPDLELPPPPPGLHPDPEGWVAILKPRLELGSRRPGKPASPAEVRLRLALAAGRPARPRR